MSVAGSTDYSASERLGSRRVALLSVQSSSAPTKPLFRSTYRIPLPNGIKGEQYLDCKMGELRLSQGNLAVGKPGLNHSSTLGVRNT